VTGQTTLRFYLVVGINKPLSSRVVLAGSSPQKAGFLVNNWSVILAEARADNDRSRVYLSQPRVLRARMWDLDNELETEFYYSLHSIVCFCFQGVQKSRFHDAPFCNPGLVSMIATQIVSVWQHPLRPH